MHTERIVAYETWDMAPPEIPPRSRLFNLEPVGLGTALVESLTSYFSRLAQAHSVSSGALLHHEVMKLGAGQRNMFTCGINFRARSFTSGINSTGGMAADFVSALSTLTSRNDLAHLTMIPWKSLFPPQMLMRGVAAWCPVCLTSWERAGKSVYVPLLWALEVVKYCPYHRCQLRLTCPHCDLPQPLIGQCSWVGFCTRCKRWLGLDSGKDDSDRYSVIQKETPDWEIWVTNQVSELIETGFRNPPLLTREQLSRLVRVGADLEGLSGFARILGVSSTAVDQWRLGAKQPLLPVYLRLARVFHVTLTDLLTGKVSPGRNQVLDLEGVPYWRNLYVRRSPHFDKVEAARRIDQALRELPPPSMRAFEKRNGYHYATLHKYFPDQCIAIQERFRESRAALTKQRRAQTAAEFRQIAYQLHEKGTDLCVNAVLKRMSPPRSLDYRIAREVLDEVKQEILANGKPLGNDLRPSRHPPTTIPSVVRAAPGCPEEV